MPMVDGKKYSYGAKGMAAAKKAAKKKGKKMEFKKSMMNKQPCKHFVDKIQRVQVCIKVYKLTENLTNVTQNGLRTTLGVQGSWVRIPPLRPTKTITQ